MKQYYVYILKCSDNSYYTGSTSNIVARIWEHNDGKYKGYTFSRRPVNLIYSQEFQSAKEMIRMERRIKGWSRKKKEALINNDFKELSKLSRSCNKKYSHKQE